MELHCAVQKYAWGKVGKSGLVAKLSLANPAVDIDDDCPYAELWMGTHVSGPSKLANTGETLQSYLKDNESSLGQRELQEFGTDLSFLFKALSAAKALSIQAHPNKEHAEQLFLARPDLYKDPNHKPEMVTAWMSPFEALCGFRPIEEIRYFIQNIKELEDIIGKDACEELMHAETKTEKEQALEKCFSSLMNCPDEDVASSLKQYGQHMLSFDEEQKKNMLCDLFARIYRDFVGDVGCWCIYFLNYVILQPGESLFLGPNVPHAYIYGDCLECMACSDNVLRAGLTPKFKDIETLCSMLDYEASNVDRFRILWQRIDEFCEECIPPVPDFAMARIALPSGNSYKVPKRSNASILVILQGQAHLEDSGEFSFGQILFAKANQQLVLQSRGPSDVIIYQAFSNV